MRSKANNEAKVNTPAVEIPGIGVGVGVGVAVGGTGVGVGVAVAVGGTGVGLGVAVGVGVGSAASTMIVPSMPEWKLQK